MVGGATRRTGMYQDAAGGNLPDIILPQFRLKNPMLLNCNFVRHAKLYKLPVRFGTYISVWLCDGLWLVLSSKEGAYRECVSMGLPPLGVGTLRGISPGLTDVPDDARA